MAVMRLVMPALDGPICPSCYHIQLSKQKSLLNEIHARHVPPALTAGVAMQL